MLPLHLSFIQCRLNSLSLIRSEANVVIWMELAGTASIVHSWLADSIMVLLVVLLHLPDGLVA